MVTESTAKFEAEKSYQKASRELIDALSKFVLVRDHLERISGERRDPGEHLKKKLHKAL